MSRKGAERAFFVFPERRRKAQKDRKFSKNRRKAQKWVFPALPVSVSRQPQELDI